MIMVWVHGRELGERSVLRETGSHARCLAHGMAAYPVLGASGVEAERPIHAMASAFALAALRRSRCRRGAVKGYQRGGWLRRA